MVCARIDFSGWRQLVDDFWQVLSQEVRSLSGIYSHFCRECFELIRTKRVLNLTAGNRLVFTHANPRLECVPLATLHKFTAQSLQTAALCEQTADNSHQRVRFTSCTGLSTSCAEYRIE